MNKIFTLLIFLILFLSASPAVFCEENANESEIVQNQEEELMFDPIELDLSGFTPENKIKRLKIRVEATDKPKNVKTYRKTWDDSKFYRYQYYSDPNSMRPLPALASYDVYLETDLDENTRVAIGKGGLSYFDGATLTFMNRNRECVFDFIKQVRWNRRHPPVKINQ